MKKSTHRWVWGLRPLQSIGKADMPTIDRFGIGRRSIALSSRGGERVLFASALQLHPAQYIYQRNNSILLNIFDCCVYWFGFNYHSIDIIRYTISAFIRLAYITISTAKSIHPSLLLPHIHVYSIRQEFVYYSSSSSSSLDVFVYALSYYSYPSGLVLLPHHTDKSTGGCWGNENCFAWAFGGARGKPPGPPKFSKTYYV